MCIIAVILIFFIVVIANAPQQPPKQPPTPPPQKSDWAAIKAADEPISEPGWNAAQTLSSSEEGWEDSLFVMPDGQRVYYAYYAGDLITDVSRAQFNGDIDTYYSDYPFTTKVKDTRFHLSEQTWSEACIDIDIDGNVWYCSNRDYLNDQKADTDIFRNGDRLLMNDALGDDTEFGNPHYCKAKDELWFDEKDTRIWVLANAAANNFSGTPEKAQSPLDTGFQPWLSEDCMTIYFTSNRGDTKSNGPAIYRSTRTGDTWSMPQLVLQSKTGVAEATLTSDDKKLFFIQLYQDTATKAFTTEMRYLTRT